jgi:hypothetical protein
MYCSLPILDTLTFIVVVVVVVVVVVGINFWNFEFSSESGYRCSDVERCALKL